MKTLTEQLHEQLYAYLPDDIAENIIDRVEAIKAERVSDTKKACKRETDLYTKIGSTTRKNIRKAIDKAEVTG